MAILVSLPAGVLCSSLLWFKLFENDYIDMDLHNLALLALSQTVSPLAGRKQQAAPRQVEHIYYLAGCGCTLYACYPATFLIVYPVLGVVLAWHAWRSRAA